MNTENSQEQTQTPKYKVGDVVWTIIVGGRCDGERVCFCGKITGIIYSRRNGKTHFRGYATTVGNESGAIKESAVFDTLEECEACIDKLEASEGEQYGEN